MLRVCIKNIWNTRFFRRGSLRLSYFWKFCSKILPCFSPPPSLLGDCMLSALLLLFSGDFLGIIGKNWMVKEHEASQWFCFCSFLIRLVLLVIPSVLSAVPRADCRLFKFLNFECRYSQEEFPCFLNHRFLFFVKETIQRTKRRNWSKYASESNVILYLK